MLRTAWSSCLDTGMVLQDDKTFHGVWAGHRFYVRLYDDVLEDMMLDGWTDVSRDLAREVFAIWNSENRIGGEFKEDITHEG